MLMILIHPYSILAPKSQHFFFQPQDRPSHVASVATVDLLSHEGFDCGSFVSRRFKNMSESKTDPPGTLAHINSSCKGKELSNYFDLASMQIQGSFTPTYLSVHNYRHKSVSS
jgi:serine/threonine protein kinase HipA of HipAB toxin-antitoxin module